MMFTCQITQDTEVSIRNPLAHCLRLVSLDFTTEKLLLKNMLVLGKEKKQMTNEQHSIWNQPK